MATFNWMITCCCNNHTEYHCYTCGENLCSTCKQKHLQNNDTRHHSLVIYTKRLTPGSLSSLLCHDHGGKECIWWCETCGKAICIDCVTKSHRGHDFTELETVLREKKANLQRELNNLKSNILKELQDLMIEARKETSDFLSQVNGIEEELSERAKEFHKKVDEIMENYKKQLNELKTSNLAILHEQEKRVSEGLEKVKQDIKDCEDRLRSSDMESLLEHKVGKDDKKDILPQLSYATPPVLTPSKIITKALTEMLGQLTVPKANQGAEGQGQSQKASTTGTAKTQTVQETNQGDETVKSPDRDTQTRSTTASIRPHTQLIPKPSVKSEFDTNTGFPSITCVGSGQAWVQTDRRVIHLLDRHGAIRTDFDFNDIILSPQGDILLADKDNKCIKSISPEKTVKKLFKVKWKPCSLYYLHSGNIAITFLSQRRVVIYNMSGKVIKGLNKELFIHPYSVAQNKINSDLYIGDRVGKVLALDKDYRLRYEYTGQSEGRSFGPNGLCTDDDGRVLITDVRNDRVDILDKDGRFLQYLLTGEQGLRYPVSIDVDSDGNAWVGEWEGGVKVVKYLQ